MNGANSQFVISPENFLRANVVNNIRWFSEAGRAVGFASNGALHRANAEKKAIFDLKGMGVNDGKRVYDLCLWDGGTLMDTAIDAYWCPFIQGNVLPGYVDVPRRNPVKKFVFTPAMNGCAFVVTESPDRDGWLRVYHNQHPQLRSVTDLIRNNSNGSLISYFAFDDYGVNVDPNAFNFLHYRNSNWTYISQPQRFTIETHGFGICYRPGGMVTTRGVA